MTPPLISIITPCLNRAAYVAEAIESVIQQGYPNLEHIVVDGGSTDGSLEILRAYPRLHMLSEPDRGLYDAINKGLRMAQGDVIGFLNTDDLYLPGTFQKVVDTLEKYPGSDAVLGSVSVFIDHPAVGRKTVAVNHPFSQENFLQAVTHGVPLFNGWFFRRVAFDGIGEFDAGYRYAADREILIRMALAGRIFVPVDQIFYCYRHHPGSLTFNSDVDAFSGIVQEFKMIAERYLDRSDLETWSHGVFKTWHSLITSHQVLLAIRSFKPALVLDLAGEGVRRNRMWPAIFGREFVVNGVRFATRGFKPIQQYG